MNKLCILAIMGISILAHEKELTAYSEIASALKEGHPIRMVVQFGDELPTFYTEANAVMLRPAYLQFANTHLTTNHPGFENSPVLENVTYRITDEGEVRILTRVLSLPEYQILKEHTLVCSLGDSAKIYSVD
jgi:VirK protein